MNETLQARSTTAVAMTLGAVAVLGWLATTGSAAAGSGPGEPEETPFALLRAAANAGRTVPYEGVQSVTRWGRSGASTSLITITHRPGYGVMYQPVVTGADTSSLGSVPHPPTPHRPTPAALSSQVALSDTVLTALDRNYRLTLAGRGWSCGRSASIVQAHRPDGSVAARFWIDENTRHMLRREVLDRQGRIVLQGAFIDFRVPAMKSPRHAPPLGKPTQPDPATARDQIRPPELRGAGFQLPARLPGNLELFASRTVEAPSGRLLHLSYSDGLSAVSLFVQRGRLDVSRLHGWRKEQRRGGSVWVRDTGQQQVIWSGDGYVYALLADAPADTVDEVLAALPSVSEAGFWTQMARGFGRLASWVNPFS